jgi:energy-coupling factor transporter ATP-binding protein EcfA2
METTSSWIMELTRQLKRGKHVLLHGNVRDLSLNNGAFMPFDVALDSLLTGLGYQLRVRYNIADGIEFEEPWMRSRFDNLMLAPETTGGRALSSGGYNPPGGGYNPPGANNPLPSSGDAGPAPAAPGPAPAPIYLQEPALALPAIRRFLKNARHTPGCVILSFSDKLAQGGESNSPEERSVLIHISQAFTEAWRYLDGPLAGMRNPLVLVAPALGQVPAWVYRDNPLVSVINVDRPDMNARKEFLNQFFSNFFDTAGQVAPGPELLEEFAVLTDGLSHWDLESICLASHHEQIPLGQIKQLIDFFKHGRKDDPWEKLNLETLEQARTVLREKVIGQDAAVESVVRVLISARGGVHMEGQGQRSIRPKGVLFFVGPTGVGKTELAKAVTELIFKDQSAFARFDMSEYQQEHASERLTGAPPSYVGYEAGGQLTNRIKQRPFSVVLFDEIEKAHPRIMDKFLQVLDDGRLTDGLGETVYFSQSLIIFTSNIGSTDDKEVDGKNSQVSAINVGMEYDKIVDHYKKKVRQYFLDKGRPEILGRIGEDNIIVFDMLRDDNIEGILAKFLRGVEDSAMEKYKIKLLFDRSVYELAKKFCAQPDEIILGGRGIRNFVESKLLYPINQSLLSSGNLGGTRTVFDRQGTIVVE